MTEHRFNSNKKNLLFTSIRVSVTKEVLAPAKKICEKHKMTKMRNEKEKKTPAKRPAAEEPRGAQTCPDVPRGAQRCPEDSLLPKKSKPRGHN